MLSLMEESALRECGENAKQTAYGTSTCLCIVSGNLGAHCLCCAWPNADIWSLTGCEMLHCQPLKPIILQICLTLTLSCLQLEVISCFHPSWTKTNSMHCRIQYCPSLSFLIKRRLFSLHGAWMFVRICAFPALWPEPLCQL